MVTTIADVQGVAPVAVVVSPVLIAVARLNRAILPGAMLKLPPARTPNGCSADAPSVADALL
jgi:hypothetical protein